MNPEEGLVSLVKLLKVTGYWLQSDEYPRIFKFFQTFRLWIIIVLSPFSFVSMYLAGVKQTLSKNAFFCSAAIYISVQAYSNLQQFDLLKLIVLKLNASFKRRKENWEIDIIKGETKQPWLLIRAYTWIFSIFFIIFQILPVFYDIYLAAFTNSTEPFIIILPYEGLSYNQKRNFWYYFVLITSYLWTMQLSFLSLGTQSLTFGLISYVSSEFKIVSNKILEWGNYSQYEKSTFENKSKLRNLIFEHKTALSLALDLKKVLGLSLAAQNIVASLSITLFLYTIMVEIKRNFMLAAIGVFGLNGMMSIAFSTCFMGEKLQNDTLLIFEKLCDIPWYEMTPAVRKDLVMMFRQSQKAISINFKGRNALNLNSFMRIINASYSYLMVLRTMV